MIFRGIRRRGPEQSVKVASEQHNAVSHKPLALKCRTQINHALYLNSLVTKTVIRIFVKFF